MAFVLSADDRRNLQDFIRSQLQKPENSVSLVDSSRNDPSMDIYIAKVPVGGIPARDGIELARVPCDIYQLLHVAEAAGSADDHYDLAQAGFVEHVVNLNEVAIPESVGYLIVHREKVGGNFVVDRSDLDLAWQATFGSSNQAITSTDQTAPDVLNFDTLDEDVVSGGIWGTLASGALPINADVRLKFAITFSVYFNDPGSLKSGTTAFWLQRKEAGGSFADLAHSGFVNSQITQSYGIYYHTYSLNRLVKVTSGDSYRVVGIYANGTAANPYVISGTGTGLLPPFTESDAAFGPNWSIEK